MVRRLGFVEYWVGFNIWLGWRFGWVSMEIRLGFSELLFCWIEDLVWFEILLDLTFGFVEICLCWVTGMVWRLGWILLCRVGDLFGLGDLAMLGWRFG